MAERWSTKKRTSEVIGNHSMVAPETFFLRFSFFFYLIAKSRHRNLVWTVRLLKISCGARRMEEEVRVEATQRIKASWKIELIKIMRRKMEIAQTDAKDGPEGIARGLSCPTDSNQSELSATRKWRFGWLIRSVWSASGFERPSERHWALPKVHGVIG